VSTAVPPGDKIESALPDWSGRIWFISAKGVVGYVDPASGAVRSLDMGETIGNSFATDESGACTSAGKQAHLGLIILHRLHGVVADAAVGAAGIERRLWSGGSALPALRPRSSARSEPGNGWMKGPAPKMRSPRWQIASA